ncbi:hypothetical protein E1176_08020 [Fulvivirga sp. RKSG066]|uniref:FISUMP domain-containing protein n=1 Tax=Fulvivirga aurantia TaxID=2529383 RepID=UPI0012BBA0D4|nr:fibrobacter succinogenes major paralogous domain-containing protein [Fulvivirga aurantia]MTI20965.1 hypothetical protein [Fulvivirga aurantia]
MIKSIIQAFKVMACATLLLVLFTRCADNELQMTDIDGNDYSVKNYQGVLWMTENLRVTKDRNGEAIQYYNPNQDSTMKSKYGLLYDYETACQVCPTGWELPDNSDWMKLIQDNGGEVNSQILKDSSFWGHEALAINIDGFSARYAGYGNNGEHPNKFEESNIIWSKSRQEDFAWAVIFEKDENKIRQAKQHLIYGFSVRCIKK